MNYFNIKNIFIITKKELRNYFDSPTAYIVLVVFLLLWEFLFFRNVFLVGEASLRILFGFLPWLFLFLIPAITMGSVSQEKNDGTLEFLLTHPLKDRDFLIGKFLAALSFVAIALLFIFPVAASLDAFGSIDWGVVFGQYLASISLASVLIALGIFVSSVFASQISSLLVSVVASFFLIIAGFEIVTASAPPFIASFLERLSALSHFNSMSRGVVDLRDLWYSLSVILVFLSLAYLQLLKRRFGNRKSLYRSYKIGILLFIGIAILTNIVGSRIPGRLDLTQNHVYTLTKATKRTLADLNDVVNITIFASNELPAQFQPILRDTKDTLRDYQTFGKGNIVVSYKNPSGNPKIAQEARSLGIREVQFNVIGQEEFKLKKGYLGLAVSYAGKSETIPFIQDTSDIEYQLTSFIKQLTTTEKNKVAFLSGHGEKGLFSDYKILSQELKKQFDLEEVSIDEETPALPDDISTLVVAGPTEEIDETVRSAIRNYLSEGGSALFLIDSVRLNPQALNAYLNQASFSDFLQEYGVAVQPDIVYDLRSNETIRFGGGFINYILPYPFWARVVALETTSPITSRIESIVLPWASTITLDETKMQEKGLMALPIFATTKFGGRQTGSFFISPDAQPSSENLEEQIVAVSLMSEETKPTAKTTRMVIVGDSDFLSDQFSQGSPENLAFGIEALSWLSQEESLASIGLKQKVKRQLLFKNETQIALVKYGNMSLVFLMLAGIGIFRFMHRKNLHKFTYSSRI